MRPISLEPGAVTDIGRCWICDSVNTLESHHCIPRAYGGERGPQVVICGVCHGAIHKYADSDLAPDRVLDLFVGYPKDHLTRAHFLAKMIMVARDSVKNDANKTVVFMDRFPAATRRQLRELAKVLKGNQQLVVRHAIAELHRRYFG